MIKIPEVWAESAEEINALSNLAKGSLGMANKVDIEVLHANAEIGAEFAYSLRGNAWNSLKRIDIHGEGFVKSIDGIMYYAEGGNFISLMICPSKKEGAVMLPEGLEYIDTNSMRGVYLKYLKIPASLKAVKKNAFLSCRVDCLELAEGIEETHLFHGLKIGELRLPKSLKTIKEGAFDNSELKRVSFPDGLETVEKGAFSECCMEEVELPESMELVGENAFGKHVRRLVIKGSKPVHGALGAVTFRSSYESANIPSPKVDYGHPVTVEVGDVKFAIPNVIVNSAGFQWFRQEWDLGMLDEGWAHTAYDSAPNTFLKHDTAVQELTLNPDNEAAKDYVKHSAKKIAEHYIDEDNPEKLRNFLTVAGLSKEVLEDILGMATGWENSQGKAYLLESFNNAEGKASNFDL